MDERKTILANLERLRAECVALAEGEDDPTVKAGLLQRSASLAADIQIAKQRKPYAPRGLGGGRLKKYRKQDGMLRKQ
jgi:hypothetical protein